MDLTSNCENYPHCLERLSAIETKLSIIMCNMADAEIRLRALETKIAFAVGGCFIISSVTPVILKLTHVI